jgi:hypothetical protein
MQKIKCSLAGLFLIISLSCTHNVMPVIDPDLIAGEWKLEELDLYSSSFKTGDTVYYFTEYSRGVTEPAMKVSFDNSNKYTALGNFTKIFSFTQNGRTITDIHRQYINNPGKYEVRENKFFTSPTGSISYPDPISFLHQMEVTILELTPKRLVLYSYNPPRPETEHTSGSGQSKGLQIYSRD